MARLELQALISLDLAFLTLSDSFDLTYASPQAGKLFAAKNQEQLRAHTESLIPIITLAQNHKRLTNHNKKIDQEKNSLSRHIVIKNLLGQTIEVIAQVAPLNNNYVVLLREVSYLEPIFSVLNRIRRLRTHMINVSCLFEERLNISEAAWSERSQNSNITTSLPSPTRVKIPKPHTDLLQALSSAISVVDPWLPPSIKIAVDAKISALLSTDRVGVLSIFSHIFLDAADFIGIDGEIRINAELIVNEKKGESFVSLELTSTRKPSALQSADFLDRYLLSRCLPRSHRVTQNEMDVKKETSNLEPTEDNQKSLSRIIHLAPDELSESARIAHKLATRRDISLNFQLKNDNLLVISLNLPLASLDS